MIPDISTLPVHDEEAALELMDGERELLEEVLDLFRESTAERVQSLSDALPANDLSALAAGAHSIKGAAANVAAERLRALATQLELDARQGESDDLEQLAQLIRDEFDRFLKEVTFSA